MAALPVLVPSASNYPTFAAGSVWVPRWTIGDVVRVDPLSGEMMANIPVGLAGGPEGYPAGPSGMAGDEDHAWVGVQDDLGFAIVEVDPASDDEVDRLRIPCRANALALEGDTLWVSCFEAAQVLRVDVESGSVVEQIPVPAAVGLTAAEDGVWVASGATGTVSRIDTDTNEVVVLRTGMDTEAIPVLSDDEVWVTGLYSGQVAILSRTSGDVLDHIDLNFPLGIARSDDTMWVTDGRPEEAGVDRLVAIDIESREVVETIPLPGLFVDRGILTTEDSAWVVTTDGLVRVDL